MKKIFGGHDALRDALFALGPEGFLFERYLAGLLAALGYETELPDEYQGSCVKHEVDIAATKDGKMFAIEAKFRNSQNDTVHLKDVMASYARYLDLLDGAALNLCPRFAEFWIVTNNAFSERAAQFGRCKGMKLIGWEFPDRANGLMAMIDRLERYPVTLLRGLTKTELFVFAKAGIMTCHDLSLREPSETAHRTGLSQSRVEELVEAAGG